MTELKNMFLTIITEYQKHKAEAKTLMDVVQDELGEGWQIEKLNIIR